MFIAIGGPQAHVTLRMTGHSERSEELLPRPAWAKESAFGCALGRAGRFVPGRAIRCPEVSARGARAGSSGPGALPARGACRECAQSSQYLYDLRHRQIRRATFIAMELPEGQTLRERLAKPLTPSPSRRGRGWSRVAGPWSFYIWTHSGAAADNGPLRGERVRRSRG